MTEEIGPGSKMAAQANDSSEMVGPPLMSSLLEGTVNGHENRVVPSLDECIQQVVSTNGPRLEEQKERTFKMAAIFTNEVVGSVMKSSERWRRYTAVPNKHEKTAVLYKDDFASFLCHIHLKRPTRLSPFLVSKNLSTAGLYIVPQGCVLHDLIT